MAATCLHQRGAGTVDEASALGFGEVSGAEARVTIEGIGPRMGAHGGFGRHWGPPLGCCGKGRVGRVEVRRRWDAARGGSPAARDAAGRVEVRHRWEKAGRRWEGSRGRWMARSDGRSFFGDVARSGAREWPERGRAFVF